MNRLISIGSGFRMKNIGLLALLFLASSLCAGGADCQAEADVTGVYEGSYRCSGGSVKLKLAMVASDDGSARGRITFEEPHDMGGRAGSYNLKGKYDSAALSFKLDPLNWNPPVPAGFTMLGVEGALQPDGKEIAGNMTGGCSAFHATRNEAESAALPKVTPKPPAVGRQGTSTSRKP
jgi:hypothetical protein